MELGLCRTEIHQQVAVGRADGWYSHVDLHNKVSATDVQFLLVEDVFWV